MYLPAMGAGYICGRLLGKGLYDLIGFEATFFLLSISLICVGVLFVIKARKSEEGGRRSDETALLNPKKP